MADDDRLREFEERYEGYTVYDNAGEKIGKVDDLFIDEADREEYIGVKMGFFGLKSTLIPMEIVRVDERERVMTVSESKDHVKDAPNFDDDEDITPEYENRVRRHFGLESLEPSAERGAYGRYAGATASGAVGATPAGGGADTEGRAGRESYRDREDLGLSGPGTERGGATPTGGVADLETGERGRMGDEGFREGSDRDDTDPSGAVRDAGPSEKGMARRDVGEPGDRDRMGDEGYREGFRQGFREGLRVGSDREDTGPSSSMRGTGATEGGMVRGDAGEPGDRGRVGEEGFREGGSKDRTTGAARPSDEARETPRRSDEEQEEGGLARVWRRIRS